MYYFCWTDVKEATKYLWIFRHILAPLGGPKKKGYLVRLYQLVSNSVLLIVGSLWTPLFKVQGDEGST